MASTPTRYDDQIFSDWFLAHVHSNAQGQFPPRTPETTAYLGYLWPTTLEYYSPLNPFFLSQIAHIQSLSPSRQWLVRDGLVPLLWFFRKNPNPGNFSGKILVRSDFAHYVPRKWLPCTGTYQMESLGHSPTSSPRKLLLAGLAMESFCTIAVLEEKLAEITKRIPLKNLRKNEILAFLVSRNDPFGDEHKHEFYGEFCKKLFTRLGLNIKFINWRQFSGMESLVGYEFLEFNEGLLIADSYLSYHCLSKGAQLFDKQQTKSTRGQLVELSPYHAMRIHNRTPDSLTLKSDDHLPVLNKIMISDANQRFPWPKWFDTWARTKS